MRVCFQGLITEVQGACKGATRKSEGIKTRSNRAISTPGPGEGERGTRELIRSRKESGLRGRELWDTVLGHLE